MHTVAGRDTVSNDLLDILFLILFLEYRPSGADLELFMGEVSQVLGHVSIGWTIGEEVLFTNKVQVRQDSCFAMTESCLLGINKQKLAMLQRDLIDTGNSKDYYVLESLLKGNNLIK